MHSPGPLPVLLPMVPIDPFWPGWISTLLAVIAGLVFAALMGLFLEFAIFRWVRTRDPVVKAVITIGVLLALQSAASLIWIFSSTCRSKSQTTSLRSRIAMEFRNSGPGSRIPFTILLIVVASMPSSFAA